MVLGSRGGEQEFEGLFKDSRLGTVMCYGHMRAKEDMKGLSP